MFYNTKFIIATFYLITTSLYIFLFYYLHTILELHLIIVALIITLLTTLSAYLIAKLATEPLLQYIQNLKTLSSQTLHELNLPIATIKTNLSMIKKNITDTKTLKRLERIDQATTMLQQRYNELDYLIKTQTTKHIKEKFNIRTLLEERVELFKELYSSYEFILETEDAQLYTDKIGLSKVIDNLIDNSVKYSPKNSKIKIVFSNNTLSVIDQGQGIDEVDLIRIFDSYYQKDNSSKGFGIGLSLVKQFCDKNNIKLHIQSKVSCGTTVTLQFKG